MKDHYKDLFVYNNWANQSACESILKTESVDQKAIKLFSHIIASQKIWLSRIESKGDNPVSPWELFPLEDCLLLSNQVGKEWIQFIDESSEDKFLREIIYINSQGKKFNNRIENILIHVVNHSTYHRGQIAAIV